MHHGMQYDLIQGQGQGHEPLKLANSVTLKGYLLPPHLASVVCRHFSTRRLSSCVTLPQKVSSISMKFGMYVKVDE